MNPAPAVAWPDEQAAYRAISGRDRRFDGRLYVGVLSTGIYCRPSCPARTPRPENCRFYTAAAAAVAAGFRACRRCRPDALPGTRQWDHRGDLAARALRAIADGAVDEHGVAGTAARLHVSERHLHRVLVTEVGASPVQLARTRRAQLARVLLDQTGLTMADVAFAAGFASVRQFNDVMRAEFGAPPTALRRREVGDGRRAAATVRRGDAAGRDPGDDDGGGRAPVDGAEVALRLRHAVPFDGRAWLAHVHGRAVPGVERPEPDGSLTRVLTAPGGQVRVSVVVPPGAEAVHVRLRLTRLADLGGVVARLRRWMDLDADPDAVDAGLGGDPLLGPLVASRPGLRVPGTVDSFELAVRAVLGQGVSVAAARTLAGRLVAAYGGADEDGLRPFPEPGTVAAAGPERLRALGLTRARAAALSALAGAVAGGLSLDPGADRDATRAALLALPGIGAWTADYIALRALGDPDAFPAGDLVLRQALGALAGDGGTVRPTGAGRATAAAAGPVTAAAAGRMAEAWRPWRGYAAQHLWTAWADRRPGATVAASGGSARTARNPPGSARRGGGR